MKFRQDSGSFAKILVVLMKFRQDSGNFAEDSGSFGGILLILW